MLCRLPNIKRRKLMTKFSSKIIYITLLLGLIYVLVWMGNQFFTALKVSNLAEKALNECGEGMVKTVTKTDFTCKNSH